MSYHPGYKDRDIEAMLASRPALQKRFRNVLAQGKANSASAVKWKAAFKKLQNTCRQYQEANKFLRKELKDERGWV